MWVELQYEQTGIYSLLGERGSRSLVSRPMSFGLLPSRELNFPYLYSTLVYTCGQMVIHKEKATYSAATIL